MSILLYISVVDFYAVIQLSDNSDEIHGIVDIFAPRSEFVETVT